MKYREVERKLRKLGCIELKSKGGSHRKWINPTDKRGAPVRDWGSKDLKACTLRAAVKQLGLDINEFIAATYKLEATARGFCPKIIKRYQVKHKSEGISLDFALKGESPTSHCRK